MLCSDSWAERGRGSTNSIIVTGECGGYPKNAAPAPSPPPSHPRHNNRYKNRVDTLARVAAGCWLLVLVRCYIRNCIKQEQVWPPTAARHCYHTTANTGSTQQRVRSQHVQCRCPLLGLDHNYIFLPGWRLGPALVNSTKVGIITMVASWSM